MSEHNSLEKAIETIIKVAQPDKIILFGSRVGKNYDKESDYDLLVLKKGIKKQRALSQKIYLNFRNIGAPIDVIVTNIDSYEQLKTNPYLIYHEAFKNGKVVYEK